MADATAIMMEDTLSISGPKLFLRNKFTYCLTLMVIATTLLSWFNINSWCIIALLLCRLLDGSPLAAIRTAFRNKYFLAYFSIFALELVGLLYTHDFPRAWKHMESKATLAAIPFILCAGSFTDRSGRRQLLSAFCALLFSICVYCLAIAIIHFCQDKDSAVFFYHTLTETIDVNAVFFSAYVVVALLFLLSHPLQLPGLPQARLRQIRIGLIGFFSIMMILLSSKLLLAMLVIILISFLARRYRLGWNRRIVMLSTSLILLGTGLLIATDNPITARYRDISRGDIRLYQKSALPPETIFNGVSLRLLIWKYSGEILNDQKAWLIGVTGGDSQDLLDDKYIAGGVSQGFLGYNFHNQYIEEMVRSGLTGLGIFLFACAALIDIGRKVASREAWFTVFMVLILYFTESMLEMQHSAFFSCFFPLLLLPENPDRHLSGDH